MNTNDLRSGIRFGATAIGAAIGNAPGAAIGNLIGSGIGMLIPSKTFTVGKTYFNDNINPNAGYIRGNTESGFRRGLITKNEEDTTLSNILDLGSNAIINGSSMFEKPNINTDKGVNNNDLSVSELRENANRRLGFNLATSYTNALTGQKVGLGISNLYTSSAIPKDNTSKDNTSTINDVDANNYLFPFKEENQFAKSKQENTAETKFNPKDIYRTMNMQRLNRIDMPLEKAIPLPPINIISKNTYFDSGRLFKKSINEGLY